MNVKYHNVSPMIETEICDMNMFLNMDSRHLISTHIINGLQLYSIINQ